METSKTSINKDLLKIARRQFCLDTCLDWQQYLEQSDKKVYIQKTQYVEGTAFPVAPGARCYGGTDAFFKAIVCMGQLFLSVDEQIYDWAVEQFAECEPEWFCEYGNLRKIDEKLREFDREIKDTHVYFLPGNVGEQDIVSFDAMNAGRKKKILDTESSDSDVNAGRSQKFTWYEQDEILCFKDNNRFTRALSFWETQPDVLAVAALQPYIENELLQECGVHGDAGKDVNVEKDFNQCHMSGMAGASADGAYLWQIGINVVPESAGKGLAVELVRRLKEEIIRRGQVPFYGTSESHIISQTVGLKSGFVPAWTEIYVKRIEK